jgi:glycosyltransferase 2 family protein
MNSKLLTKIVAIIITIVLLALLFTQIDLADVISTLKNINPIYLIFGFLLYTCSYFFRAWRFHILLNKEVSIKDLFHIECVHNMMNNLLPARTGELSYIYLLKNVNNRTTAEGFATLIIARTFDFTIVVGVFLVLFLFINNLNPVFTNIVFLAIFVLISIDLFLFLLLTTGNKVLEGLNIFFKFIKIEKHWLAGYIVDKSEQIVEYFEIFKHCSSKDHLSIIITSFGIWVMTYSLFYTLAMGMNIQLDSVQILFASSFSIFSTILPIQGIAGFGTMESGWALGFVSVSLSKEVAISTGFSFHIIVLIYTLILGGLAYFILYKYMKTNNIQTY